MFQGETDNVCVGDEPSNVAKTPSLFCLQYTFTRKIALMHSQVFNIHDASAWFTRQPGRVEDICIILCIKLQIDYC